MIVTLESIFIISDRASGWKPSDNTFCVYTLTQGLLQLVFSSLVEGMWWPGWDTELLTSLKMKISSILISIKDDAYPLVHFTLLS